MRIFDLPHIGFVIAAYTVAVVIIGALVAAVVIDYRAQRRALAALEAEGIDRRPPGDPRQ